MHDVSLVAIDGVSVSPQVFAQGPFWFRIQAQFQLALQPLKTR